MTSSTAESAPPAAGEESTAGAMPSVAEEEVTKVDDATTGTETTTVCVQPAPRCATRARHPCLSTAPVFGVGVCGEGVYANVFCAHSRSATKLPPLSPCLARLLPSPATKDRRSEWRCCARVNLGRAKPVCTTFSPTKRLCVPSVAIHFFTFMARQNRQRLKYRRPSCPAPANPPARRPSGRGRAACRRHW